MLIGQSRDFGVCKSKTRAGNSCTNVINRWLHILSFQPNVIFWVCWQIGGCL